MMGVLVRYLLLAALLNGYGLACAEEPFSAPAGYHIQVLESTDGRIAVPDGWNYRSNGTPSGWLWTVSKEINSDGSYETGWRLQLIVNVKNNAKKSPMEFALEFLDKRRRISKVDSECGPDVQGDFTRQCIQVTEKSTKMGDDRIYRIMYSVSWSEKLDMVLVNTFGTPDELWYLYSDVPQVMSVIELWGPNIGR